MAAETKNKGLFYRMGQWIAQASGRYLKFEEKAARWMGKKGSPPTVNTVIFLVVRLALIGGFLYLAFWIAVFVISLFVLKEMLMADLDTDEDIVVFDGEKLCPDPYAPENINDPAFHHDL
ncbi:DUF3742 family protein [Pseudomonas gingeri]|uniref:DUF3742 family protein n=1 Tax=Pseudomonas gingeri TaxID=117681 RepID=UPI0015A13227|nr:DUF3742 family protein [Pseudomonas gingeri]NWD71163.1 DUF3742 family protein [Pseudomonas gingeri]